MARIAIGVLLLLLGAIMIVTPGPALVLIPAGLFMIASVHPPLHHWLSVRGRWIKTKWARRRQQRRARRATGAD